jgi:hypothetical protein
MPTFISCNIEHYKTISERTAQFLAVLLLMQEVSGSYLGPDTVYPDYVYRGFHANYEIRPRPLPFISFPIHYSSFITIHQSLVTLSFGAVYSELLRALLNKP